MRELASGVWQLDGWPPNMLNVYLLEDVLIDAATRYDEGRILRQLRGREVAAHALTHAHADHLGSSHAVCDKLGIPFWVGEHDVAAAEDTDALAASLLHFPFAGGQPLLRMLVELEAGPGHPVARRLREGDDVAGFRVLEVPGHSAGHLAFWRESDRVLIAGDVLWNFQFFGGMPGPMEPLPITSVDPALNRASARRLAGLEPELVCFGHGPPLRDGREFVEFVEQMAEP